MFLYLHSGHFQFPSTRMLTLSQIVFKNFFDFEIEHVTSPVPIKCELELQNFENITNSFDSDDETQGSDQIGFYTIFDSLSFILIII